MLVAQTSLFEKSPSVTVGRSGIQTGSDRLKEGLYMFHTHPTGFLKKVLEQFV